MSKRNEEADNQRGCELETQHGAAGEPSRTCCVIEEHAVSLGISAPVFAAVKQYKGWADGKKIEQSVFEEAVKTFLGASAGDHKNVFT